MKKQLMIGIFALTFFAAGAQEHDHKGHKHKKDTTAAKPATKATGKKATDSTRVTDSTKAGEHDHMGHDHATDTVKKTTNAPAHQHAPDAAAHDHEEEHSMSHAYSLNLPMNRNGSGTGWLPDNSPMYGYMYHKNNWMYMLHGNLFLRYNNQDLLDNGTRGDAMFDVPSWAMFMGQRRVGRSGLFHFSLMASLDPLIAGGNGYPLLFQTGETWKGEPLVDRQHPHDLISELSVSYAHALSPKADVFVYLGYPGEPAIGPVAFMHRPSALPNPDATLTHHWTDATHITFGVATVGLRYSKWKIEGSSFTGREPDENRYDFDKPRFDSWSGRLSFNPTNKWAAQVSHGFIKQPELLHPDEDVTRTTASLVYSSKNYVGSFFNATALWGVNRRGHHDGENGFLLEGTYTNRKISPYFRYEWVEKSVEELQLDEASFGHDAIFPIHAFTAGINYDLFNIGNTKFALGGHITFFNPDEKLHALYGQNPLAGQLYLRIFPSMMGKQLGRFFVAH